MFDALHASDFAPPPVKFAVFDRTSGDVRVLHRPFAFSLLATSHLFVIMLFNAI
jgi:hypothetical protein